MLVRAAALWLIGLVALVSFERRLKKTLTSLEARDLAIDFIAKENRIPRFLARRVYSLLVTRSSQRESP